MLKIKNKIKMIENVIFLMSQNDILIEIIMEGKNIIQLEQTY